MASSLLSTQSTYFSNSSQNQASQDDLSATTDALNQDVGATTTISTTLSTIATPNDLINTAFGLLPDQLSAAACFTYLAEGIAAFATSPTRVSNSNQDSKILVSMVKPFKDAFSLLGDIVLPADSSGNRDSSLTLSGFLSNLGDAALNPLELFLNTQSSLLGTSIDGLLSQFFAGNTDNPFFQDYKNAVLSALQKLFLSDDADGNLIGMVIYAFNYGIPSIDAEITALQSMKALAINIAEQCSVAPIKINVQLPNMSVDLDLCEAEEALRIAYTKMMIDGTSDRTMLSYAAKKICEARDTIYDGTLSKDFLANQATNFFGLSGPGSGLSFKAGDIALGKLLPQAVFKARVDQLTTLAQVVKNQDDQIVILYNNILNAYDNIKALSEVQVSRVLAPLILFLRNAVVGVRIDLEAAGIGVIAPTLNGTLAQANAVISFTYQKPVFDNNGNQIGTITATTTDVQQYRNIQAQQILAQYPNIPEAELRRRIDLAVQAQYSAPTNTGAQSDVWSYLSSQAAAYQWLALLCPVAQKMPAIFSFLDRIASGEGLAMRTLARLVENFNVAKCAGATDPTIGGQRVIAHVNDVIRAAQNRFAGLPGAQQQIAHAVRQLRIAIADRLRFLTCFRAELSSNLGPLGEAFAAASDSVALYHNLNTILNQVGSLRDMILSMSLKDLFGDSTATGLIIKGIQCLLASCDSPALRTLSVDILDTLNGEFDNSNALSFVMKSFDGQPHIAASVGNSRRLQKILQLIAEVNQILGMNFDALCTDDQKKKRQQLQNTLDTNVVPTNVSSLQFYDYESQRQAPQPFGGI